jgi:hypothetical protein
MADGDYDQDSSYLCTPIKRLKTSSLISKPQYSSDAANS